MNKQAGILGFLLVIFAADLQAQHRVFGPDQGNCIGRNTVEGPQAGTYLFFGAERPVQQPNQDLFCLYLLDAQLQTLSIKHIEVAGNAAPGSMAQLSNGDYALAGLVYDAQGNSRAWMARLNPQLDTLWTKTIAAASGNASFKRVVEAPNGTLGWLGTHTRPGGNDNDLWLYTTDALGTKLWEFFGGDTDNDVGQGLAWHPQGFWLLSGDVLLGTYGNMVVALDSLGQFQWQRFITDQNTNGNQTLLAHSQGDIFLVGESTTDQGFAFDLFVVRLNASGQIQRYGYVGESGTDAGFQAEWLGGDTLLVTGYTASYPNAGPVSPYILTMNMDFEEVAIHWLPRNQVSIGQGLYWNPWDRRALVSGSEGDRHFVWRTGLDSLTPGIFESALVLSVSQPKKEAHFWYPNPANRMLHPPLGLMPERVAVYDLYGQLVWGKSMDQSGDIPLSLPYDWPNGHYMLEWMDGQGAVHRQKLSIQR